MHVDTTEWIALGQLITAVLGIAGVIITLRLNTKAVRLRAEALALNVDAEIIQLIALRRLHLPY